MTIALGLQAVVEHLVAESDTAQALGSGEVPVLATPRLLAWCEEATIEALRSELRPGVTSVGTRVVLDHLLATPVGGRLSVRAELVHVDGRLMRFEFVAHDATGMLACQGHVTRVLVDRDRFLARVPRG